VCILLDRGCCHQLVGHSDSLAAVSEYKIDHFIKLLVDDGLIDVERILGSIDFGTNLMQEGFTHYVDQLMELFGCHIEGLRKP